MKARRLGSMAVFAMCVGACAPKTPSPDTAAARGQQPAVGDGQLDWVITPGGLGPLRAGMTRAQAERVLGGLLAVDGDSAWKECGYAHNDRLPPGVRVMVEGGTIARFDVDSGHIATAEGARIGDTEPRIDQLYAGRVVTTPQKYTSGHSLSVSPAIAGDTMHRIVFETDGKRVTRYRSGRRPPVDYVEGCG